MTHPSQAGYWCHGSQTGTTHTDWLRQANQDESVQRSGIWILDPENHGQRLPGFAGLVWASKFDPSACPALVESRLFLEGGSLHSLSGEGQVRWSAFWTGKADWPTWVPSQAEAVQEEALEATSYPVLLAGSQQASLGLQPGGAVHRGLSRHSLGSVALECTEYRSRGLLRWWTLQASEVPTPEMSQ